MLEPAEARLADLYQKKLADIEAIYRQGDVQHAREEFRDILPNVEHVFNWCAEHASSNDVAAVLATKLAGVPGHSFEAFFKTARLIQWREAGLAAVSRLLAKTSLPEASRRELTHDLVGHLTYLAVAHLRNGNHERGRLLCEDALRSTTAVEFSDERAAALVHLAMLELDANRDRASALLHKARALVGKDAKEIRATIETVAGALANRNNAPEQAREHYLRAAKIYREIKQSAREATALTNLAGALLETGAVDDAEQAVDRALELEAQIDDLRVVGLARTRKAQILQAKIPRNLEVVSEYEGALSAFLEAGEHQNTRSIAQFLLSVYASVANSETNSPEQRIEARRREARMADILSDSVRKQSVLTQLLKEAEAQQDNVTKMWALGQIGRQRFLENAYAEAAELLENALSVLEKSKSGRYPDELTQNESELQNLLGQAYRHLGQPKDAIRALRRASDIASDEDAHLRALGNLALVLAEEDAHRNEARRQFRIIAEAYRMRGDVRLMAHALFNEAYVDYLAGEIETAIGKAEYVIEILHHINDHAGLSTIEPQLTNWKSQKSIESTHPRVFQRPPE